MQPPAGPRAPGYRVCKGALHVGSETPTQSGPGWRPEGGVRQEVGAVRGTPPRGDQRTDSRAFRGRARRGASTVGALGETPGAGSRPGERAPRQPTGSGTRAARAGAGAAGPPAPPAEAVSSSNCPLRAPGFGGPRACLEGLPGGSALWAWWR